MPFQLAVNVLIVEALDIVGEPFILESQLPEEGRFARALVADQSEHIIKLTSGIEYAGDSAQ